MLTKNVREATMAGQTSGQQRGRVLVVDDDPEVIQILEVNLEHANFEVISARNGIEALAKASIPFLMGDYPATIFD